MARVSTETMTVGILAVLFAIVGAYLLRQYWQQPAATPPPRKTRIPLAAVELPAGKPIAIGDIAMVDFTDEQLRQRKFPLEYLMLQPTQILNRRLREPLAPGEPFLLNKFYPVGGGPTLDEKLKPGYRAVTIEIDKNTAVGGFTSAGTLVDVMFKPNIPIESKTPQTMFVLLQAVEVLALDNNMNPGPGTETPKSVTLAVTPDQAQAIELVRGFGSMSLVLRNRDEPIVPVARHYRTLEDVLKIERPQAQPEIPPFVTAIYRGGNPQVNTFPRGGQADPQTMMAADFAREVFSRDPSQVQSYERLRKEIEENERRERERQQKSLVPESELIEARNEGGPNAPSLYPVQNTNPRETNPPPKNGSVNTNPGGLPNLTPATNTNPRLFSKP